MVAQWALVSAVRIKVASCVENLESFSKKFGNLQMSTHPKEMWMQEFLSGAKLAKRIRKVCKGDNVRIAVAYWGKGIPEALALNKTASSKIICDISSGGTNPAALRSLGAPNNKMLRHVHKLHAKVYISSLGCVVGSANASKNGIGNAPITLEAGIFCGPQEDLKNTATYWFEKLWESAEHIGDDAMKRCEKNWRLAAASRAVEAQERQISAAILSELLRENPESFGDIQFLLTNEPIDPKTQDMAIKINQEENPDQDPKRFCLLGWGDNDESEVPPRFISIHRGLQGGYWLSLLTPGFLIPKISAYCAVPHRLTRGPFIELNGILRLRGYRNWGKGGSGYSLGREAFEVDSFKKAVGDFHTAEELSELIF